MPSFEGKPDEGKRIVISGVAGLFPGSRNVKELSDILYNKEYPISSENCRWKYEHPEMVPYMGKVPDLELFDAQFFKVHYRLSQRMDPMSRKILEQAYQAIYDAGISPQQLGGVKTGVYLGCGFSETEKASFFDESSRNGFGLIGCNKSMFANRISYWLNAKGPSLSIDQACCSTFAALVAGYQAILRGECEAALVAASSLCLHPQNIVHYNRAHLLSPDGKVRSFDAKANGCVKSEAVGVLFLQRAKDALRVYAEVVYVKSQFSSLPKGDKGPNFGFYRNPTDTINFLNNFYKEANVPPQAVKYVEAFGSGIPDADKAELEAISEVFCKGRDKPLFVGSVTSNIGYSESASGMSAITKVLLGYNTGTLASNLHCDTPRQDVDAIKEGRIQIVTEHHPMDHSYAAINSYSYNGVNAHVLLKGHNVPKDLNRYKTTIPYLVTISGRQESSVEVILKDLISRPIDPEELALLHNIHEKRISAHLGRGFTILATNEENETISLCERKGYFDDATRPLWFVYSGMGSQWAGMGTELMRIPTFAAAIQRCHAVLEPKGVDIVKIITSPDPKTFDNILNSFVGNAAIQIGLTDILRKLEIFPDKVIGHSVGELGCAYADGCFTAEEMIMVAYSRGLVSIQTPFIVGSMAAVGRGHQEIIKMLPPEIEVACHNSSTSCTISGPREIMKTFISQLTSKKIFAKEVACSNIAYHSRYIAEAGPGLLEHLNKVIKEPKLRSERWVSTSVPQDQWNEPSAMYSSAEYHTNNLLRPVLFEEALKLIPPNAVLVEIAPHGLLQAILKRSLPVSCLNLSLTQRGNSENINYLLKSIGELYMVGFNPVIKTLYPKIDFPVSTGTPMLSHLVEWVHDEKWKIPLYLAADKRLSASCNFVISVHDDEHSYLRGHVIREKNVYPFASALVAVWDTLVMSLGLQRKKLSVQFSDVRFHSQPILNDERLIQLNVMLHRGNGKFEVMDGKTVVISGFIKEYNTNLCQSELNDKVSTENGPSLNAEDIYNLLSIRDYNYFGDFRSIHCANASITKAKVLWRDSWDTFIDGLLQLNFLSQSHNTTSQIKFIKNIEINVNGHISNNGAMESGSTLMTAHLDRLDNSTRCGGVFLQNVQLQNLPKTNGVTETMDTLKFIPHFSTTAIEEATLLDIYLQEVADNTNKDIINLTKINNSYKEDVTSSRLSAVVRKFVEKKIKFRTVSRNKILSDTSLQNVDLVFVENLSIDNDLCRSLYSMLNMNTFIINKEDNGNLHSIPRPSLLYRVVCAHSTGNNRLELIRWRPSTDTREISAISVNSQTDLPMLFSTIASIPDNQSLIVLSCYPPLPMLKNIVKDYRKTTNKNISIIMISKTSNQFESGQLCNPDLAFSIVVDDVMGGEYCLPIPQTSTIEGGMSLEHTGVDANSLKWVEVPALTGSGIKVMVHYAGLSIVDAKKIAGIIKSTKHENQNVCGMEFSGIVEGTGSRVMGLVENGAVSTKIQVHPNMLWPVPDYWSLEDAATVPLAYCLALYCLCIKSHLYSGMRILVHGGTGALGQAVISIALAHGCEVFTTVSSMSKKSFLRKLFPELKDDHIGNSRNDSFCDMVLNITKGKGCDIVISNVKGELRSTTLKCCGSSGITIDTTLLQDQEDYNLGMAFMFFSRGFTTIDITSIFSSENIEILKRLQLLVSEGIARGYVRPLSRITYGAHDAPEALRLLAGNRHRGRVLLDLKQISPIVQTRLKCSPEFNHLVVSDDDIFGIHLIERLISRGAKKLFLQWKNPSNILEFKARSWEKKGINVNIYYEDVLNADNARELLDKISTFGPIEGIYLIAIDDNYATKMENVLKRLTLIKQKFNPYLKYSTIVRVDSKNEEKRCNFELKHHEIPTIIKLPKLKGINDPLRTENKDLISVQNAIDALEFTLTAPQISGVALKWSDKNISILERIFSISDLNKGNKINLGDVNLSMTLKDLGIDMSTLDSIQACLSDYYNVSRSHDNILNLTVRELIEIEKGVLSKTRYEETQGMWTFFSYVDKDELQATNKMIFMPSLTRKAAMNSQEFDLSQTYLCVVPGIEGHYKRFQNICERLKLPVLLLQPGLEKTESICETAERLVEIMPKKAMEIHKRFYLLGYENGVFIALKMAAILEDKGWTGTVFCIGGSPDEICKTINNKLQEYDTDEALQVAVIKHIFTLMTGADTKELDCALSNSMTWQDRVECCVQNLRGRVGYSNQFTRELIESTYSRVAQLRSDSAELRAIQSQLVSMRSKSPDDHETESSLQRYSKNPVIEYDLNVPFSYLTKDPQCSSIINRHLDKDILKEFENINLCETYLVNEGFITNV